MVSVQARRVNNVANYTMVPPLKPGAGRRLRARETQPRKGLDFNGMKKSAPIRRNTSRKRPMKYPERCRRN
jgi:hypothetical protein